MTGATPGLLLYCPLLPLAPLAPPAFALRIPSPSSHARDKGCLLFFLACISLVLFGLKCRISDGSYGQQRRTSIKGVERHRSPPHIDECAHSTGGGGFIGHY
ncbi:hypothetical protein GQ54DRAFT_300677 [Martensiomyces pterosporus]|nr:hypothetical protein GQ54DRAFT_300677 [Martensiomyces pterosporus]